MKTLENNTQEQSVALSCLPINICGKIEQVLEKAWHSKLLSTGFLPGEKIEVLRRGLGKTGNLVVRLGAHSQFALRHEEAQAIIVSRENLYY